MVERISTLMS